MAINAGAFGFCYTFGRMDGRIWAVILAGVAGLAAFYNGFQFVAGAVQRLAKTSAVSGWLVVLALNLVVFTVQMIGMTFFSRGVMVGAQVGSLVVVGICIFAQGFRFGFLHVLTTIAVGFAGAAALNYASSLAGYSPAEAEMVAVEFTSNYRASEYRWISPLTNHWQLSGVLRWAVPVLLLVSFPAYFKRSWIMGAAIFAALGATSFVLVKLEYRGAMLPLGYALLWVAVKGSLARQGLTLAALGYFVAAPFLWASTATLGVLERIVPDWATAVLGTQQDFVNMIYLSGRVTLYRMVMASWDSFPVWIGMGQLKYDGVDIIGIPLGWESRMARFVSLPLHQSFLDLLAIYGMALGLVITGYMLWALVRLCRATRWRRREAETALLSAGVTFVSLAHDSFLKEDNGFFIILAATLGCGLALLPRPPAAPEPTITVAARPVREA